ncbi:hypothetical protein ACEYYB_03290 [Paracoccus sp. p4-l81]|uniref:hypothetical protein n=1 Tax=unclassified Paracoccus (in: a-proteobacteria) TaxID=2688777 RepID=UPI0035B8A873
MARIKPLLAALTLALPIPAWAADDGAPMSAVDWLSPSLAPAPGVDTRQVPPPAWRPGQPNPGSRVVEPPVAQTGAVGPVTTLRLGEANPESLGLMPADRARLPADLWSGSQPGDVAALIATAPADGPPGIGALLRRLLVARLDPMPGAQGQVFLARVDRLLDLGALDAAQGLLDAAGPGDAERFRRRFDVALLTGHETRACATLDESPGLTPSLPVRLFCLARGGDWSAAMTSFVAARALDLIDPEMSELLLRFLDPEHADGAAPLTPNGTPTPLSYRLMEAIGEPLPTHGLPLAFAQADLSANTGWRAQIEASERLARAGALRADRLFDSYGHQRAAASGGVWDRVAAIAALNAALADLPPGDGPDPRLDAALVTACDRLAEAGLIDPLAEVYAPRLLPRVNRLGPAGGACATRLGLMTEAAADWTATPGAATAPPLALALARPDSPLPQPGDNAMEQAVWAGFADTAQPSQTVTDLLAADRRGEALLASLADLAEGAGGGDPRRLTAGLVALHRLGLEADARLIARQALILHDRR